MSTLTNILAAIEAEARSAPFDLDTAVYKRAKRNPTSPILVAGNLEADVCLFARDLGQEEVLRGQPLIGSAGRRVRKAIFERLTPKKITRPAVLFQHTRRRSAHQHGAVQASWQRRV